MEVKTIIIPSGTKYLSEQLAELPKNVLFDKGRTGCGGTTIAINSKENYIIAVPFTELANNKAEQSGGKVFSFVGGTDINGLKTYLKTHATKKIMVTYDSLEKLIKHTGTKDYNLLVDEYHLLFTQYSFREKAIKQVLNHFDLFDSFTFMTATELEEDFILNELKNIPVIKAEWEDIKEVKVQSVKCIKNVKYQVIDIINKFLDGRAQGNAYFFVNSVDFIKATVKACLLTDENTRAIWSTNNNKNVGIKRGRILDDPKKINFLTSTCFEGVDIYDPDAKIFIISDGSKAHTLTDISTSFQQIAGRVRNSKYLSLITHIYSNTRYEDVQMTYDRYKQHIKDEIIHARKIVDTLNCLDEHTKRVVSLNKDNHYIAKENGKYLFDENLVKMDMYNFKITKHLYRLRVTLTEETERNGFKVIDFTSAIGEEIMVDISHIDDEVMEMSFEESVEYLETLDNGKLSTKKIGVEETVFEKYPFLDEALQVLGFRGIKALKYHQGNIKRKLISTSTKDNHNKIIMLLYKSSEISVGKFIPSSKLKEIFGKIYVELGIKQASKASDIHEYYVSKETSKYVSGKSTKGYLLLNKKLISAND